MILRQAGGGVAGGRKSAQQSRQREEERRRTGVGHDSIPQLGQERPAALHGFGVSLDLRTFGAIDWWLLQVAAACLRPTVAGSGKKAE